MALIPIVGPCFGIDSVIFMSMFKDGRDKEMINKQLCINPVVKHYKSARLHDNRTNTKEVYIQGEIKW
ncbi:hypothetical protein Hdeb2414_s0007g00248821 [Helianthus debilis subsp. tardiflorus]